MEEAAPKTLADGAFRTLRSDILSLRLSPGHWLKFDELKDTYGVSITPLREALSRLSSLGLVDADGQRGFRVTEVSLKALVDLSKTRILIEVSALRAAIAAGDRNWEAEIMAAAHLIAHVPQIRKGDGAKVVDEDWETHHRAFHTALVAACPTRRLLAYREQLFYETDRYRRLATLKGARGRNVSEEHRLLVKAVLARDSRKASALMIDHLLAAVRSIAQAQYTNAAETDILLQQMRVELRVLLGDR